MTNEQIALLMMQSHSKSQTSHLLMQAKVLEDRALQAPVNNKSFAEIVTINADAFRNSKSVLQADLPTMKAMNLTGAMKDAAEKTPSYDAKIYAVCEDRFIEWLQSEPFKAKVEYPYKTYLIGGVRIELFTFSIAVLADDRSWSFYYNDYESAIDCIIDAYKKLDKNIFHRIFK